MPRVTRLVPAQVFSLNAQMMQGHVAFVPVPPQRFRKFFSVNAKTQLSGYGEILNLQPGEDPVGRMGYATLVANFKSRLAEYRQRVKELNLSFDKDLPLGAPFEYVEFLGMMLDEIQRGIKLIVRRIALLEGATEGIAGIIESLQEQAEVRKVRSVEIDRLLALAEVMKGTPEGVLSFQKAKGLMELQEISLENEEALRPRVDAAVLDMARERKGLSELIKAVADTFELSGYVRKNLDPKAAEALEKIQDAFGRGDGGFFRDFKDLLKYGVIGILALAAFPLISGIFRNVAPAGRAR